MWEGYGRSHPTYRINRLTKLNRIHYGHNQFNSGN